MWTGFNWPLIDFIGRMLWTR